MQRGYTGVMDSDPQGESKLRSLVIFCLSAVGIGTNVYLLADQMSDGAFSRELSIKWTNFKAKMKKDLNYDRQLKSDTARMLWEAIQTVEGKN
jgi:hypothetical protein